jgi:colanic acid/amylovoran biosynthesis glycosyltransferase
MPNPGSLHVGHFRTPFLSRSETFIYSYLIHLPPAVRSFVFTSEVANADAFPFDRVVLYPVPRFTAAKWNVATRLWRPHELFLAHAMKRRRIAVLHAHFGPEGWEMLRLKRRLKLPMVTSFYGYDASYIARDPVWRERYQELFAEGDLFLVEGPALKQRLEVLGCPPAKLAIQPIAVDLDLIRWRARHPERDAPRRFLFCGRFMEKKGLIYALRAFRELIEEGCERFEFRVAGDGEGVPVIRQFIEDHNLQPRVTLLGFVSYHQFLEQLDWADVFVAPSVTADNGDSEGGAPTTIIEAQAAGVPVVATRHADIPFVVSEGDTALLAQERDVTALKRHLQFFIDHPEVLSRFGRAGRAFVERRHDIRREARELEQRYRNLQLRED